MDGARFDDLSRKLAGRLSRRAALTGVTTGLLGALGLWKQAEGQVSQAQCGNKRCKNNPGTCNDGCVCCVYENGNSRCRPPGACGPGEAVCPDGAVFDPRLGCVAPECVVAADCPPPPNLCFAAVCVDGSCGVEVSFSECNEVACAIEAACTFTAGGEPVCARWNLPCILACANDTECGPGEVCLDLNGGIGSLCCETPSTGCGVIATDVYPPPAR